ncbi:hypothetical protein [Streptomyces canus]|uniref:hypothetical protein n=1 Tax=Streptomyces canus TaxID=58343 RepID=UPI002253E7FF|nr:hypothetical protein [Streptomyces canus]MCX4856630.1 hypothetical protein [Streptomyces canus]
MLLSEKDLEDFQAIQKGRWGKRLTAREAHEQAAKLISVVDLLNDQRELTSNLEQAAARKIVSGGQ